ncbi:MAG: tRNA (adenosine(37)-N6)-threonylcarbamoyltransferase complex ATPase subunit type 1 TsaE [Proteobacteria bacterium]|nr:tRNA (adenosine(37)-N6)-threonylcarbamoyltransferase complex ATPase subunit type 1 TsaE [Pseudomonadota bacterium]
MSSHIIKIASLEDTKRVARQLADIIPACIQERGLTVGLVGDLGGGKTTFTRALAEALGAREPVSSPTFVLCHEYSALAGLVIQHWDIYRLRDALPEELIEPPRPNELRIIEWIDRSPELIREAIATLHFTLDGQTERTVTVKINLDHPHAAQWSAAAAGIGNSA